MRQSKSIASNFGFHARVFDNDDVIRLLAAAVESEGSQTAFAKHHGINRTYLNMIFHRKKPGQRFHCRGCRPSQGLYRPKVNQGLGGNGKRASYPREGRASSVRSPYADASVVHH